MAACCSLSILELIMFPQGQDNCLVLESPQRPACQSVALGPVDSLERWGSGDGCLQITGGECGTLDSPFLSARKCCPTIDHRAKWSWESMSLISLFSLWVISGLCKSKEKPTSSTHSFYWRTVCFTGHIQALQHVLQLSFWDKISPRS